MPGLADPSCFWAGRKDGQSALASNFFCIYPPILEAESSRPFARPMLLGLALAPRNGRTALFFCTPGDLLGVRDCGYL